jgi:transposase
MSRCKSVTASYCPSASLNSNLRGGKGVNELPLTAAGLHGHIRLLRAAIAHHTSSGR